MSLMYIIHVSLPQVFGHFSSILEALSVHLVEASPALSQVQETTLAGKTAV